MTPAEEVAPEGQVWLCGACGKTNPTRSDNWDTSCRTHAVLVYIKSLRYQDGRVIGADAVPTPSS